VIVCVEKHKKHILALDGKEKCITLKKARPAKPVRREINSCARHVLGKKK